MFNQMPTILTVAAGLAMACAMPAQTSNPMSTEARQAYAAIKNNLTRAAEKMPEESYAFKPTAEQRTFGETIAHVAEAQMRTCSAVKGEAKSAGATGKTAKADLVQAFKASSAECDAAFETLTDANAAEMIKTPRGERSRLGMLVGNTVHDNETYGTLAVYMRLKGVVPPSSDRSERK